jgi:hypothetical protein
MFEPAGGEKQEEREAFCAGRDGPGPEEPGETPPDWGAYSPEILDVLDV